MTDTPLFDRPAAVQDLRESKLRIPAPPAAPRDYASEAIAWREANRPLYRFMRGVAHKTQLRFGWWSMKYVFEYCRFFVRMKRHGRYKLDNGLTAALARMICADVPWLAEGAEFRRSRSGPMPYQDARVCPGAKGSD